MQGAAFRLRRQFECTDVPKLRDDTKLENRRREDNSRMYYACDAEGQLVMLWLQRMAAARDVSYRNPHILGTIAGIDRLARLTVCDKMFSAADTRDESWLLGIRMALAVRRISEIPG
jgi:hypothetical protein